MSIIKEGFYFAGVALLIALFVGVLIHPYAAILPAVLACYCIYFFRNPARTIPADENLIVSPADGTVQDVVDAESDFVKSPCRKVIIFLSVFDVHVNRSPIAGEIKIQKYICGRFRTLSALRIKKSARRLRRLRGFWRGALSVGLRSTTNLRRANFTA